ncbi:MAG: hypothetical protein ACT4OZ_16150 [Gemmatimonadota bacterium]
MMTYTVGAQARVIEITPQPPAPPAPPGAPLVNADRAIELLQAQIAGVKQEIADLTQQLTPGASRIREQAIESQLSIATDRLTSLQSQLDRVISGDGIPLTGPRVIFEEQAIPREVVGIIEVVLVSLCIIVLGLPIVRTIARRFDRAPHRESPETGTRFDRLEQAVDAVAIEVERIAEGQRYSARLLSEMRTLPSPNPLEQWPGERQSVREEVRRP